MTDFTTLSLAAITRSYNVVAAYLGETEVRKFSDKTNAARRLTAIVARVEGADIVTNADLEIVAVQVVSPAPTPSEVTVVEDAQRGELGTGWDHPDGQRLLARTEDLVTEAPASVGGLTTLELTHRIEVLVANPKRKGSRARQVFDLYRTGMTGEEFVAAVLAAGMDRRVALANLHWDIDHGFVYLGADVSPAQA